MFTPRYIYEKGLYITILELKLEKIIDKTNDSILILEFRNKNIEKKIPTFTSFISLIISCLTLSVNIESNDLNNYQFLPMIFLIISQIIIIGSLLSNNVSHYSLRLEVINDLIKEYEDKLLQEKKLFKTYLQSKYKLSDFEINQIIDDEYVFNQKYKEFQDYLDTNRKELKEKRLRINNDSST